MKLNAIDPGTTTAYFVDRIEQPGIDYDPLNPPTGATQRRGISFIRETSATNYAQLCAIQSSDGAITRLDPVGNGYFFRLLAPEPAPASLTCDALRNLQAAANVKLTVADSQLIEIRHVNDRTKLPADLRGLKSSDRIRRFQYIPEDPGSEHARGFLAKDQWFDEIFIAIPWPTFIPLLKRSTEFIYSREPYDTVAAGVYRSRMLAQIIDGGSGGQTTYTVTPAAVQGLLENADGTHFIAAARDLVATVQVVVNDLRKYDEAGKRNDETQAQYEERQKNGVPNAGTFTTRYTFDLGGLLTRQEEFFNSTSLRAEEWRYDHVGSVIDHCERTAETGPLPYPITISGLEFFFEWLWRRRVFCRTPIKLNERFRETYFRYDYNTPVSYQGDTDPTSTDDTRPRYDSNDYRGNVTFIVSRAGVTKFDYETDDEYHWTDANGNAHFDVNYDGLGRLVRSVDVRGTATLYTRNLDGRVSLRRTIRGVDDRFWAFLPFGVPAGDQDYIEAWTYYDGLKANGTPDVGKGELASYKDARGLVTNYALYDDRHRVKQVRTTDNYGGPAATVCTDTEYAAAGFLNQVKVSNCGSMTISISLSDYDTTGLLRRHKIEVPTLDASGNIVMDPEDEDEVFLHTAAEQRYEYDPDGRVTAVYNGRVVNGLPVRTVFKYDLRGLVTETIAAAGSSYWNSFLGIGGTNKEIQQKTTVDYYADGSPKRTVLPDGTIQQFYRDPVERTQWVSMDGVAGVSLLNDRTIDKTQFDELGRIVDSKNLLTGSHVHYQYADGRLDLPTTTTRDYAPTVGSKAETHSNAWYDVAGNVLLSVQYIAESSNWLAPMYYQYDALGYTTLTQRLATYGAKWKFESDPAGDVIKQVETRRSQFDSDDYTTRRKTGQV